MSVKCSEITAAIEKIAPRRLAESWDNVGLQVGSYKKEIQRVLLTLDVTEEVINEAIEKNADMIISHHPFIFGGVKSICTDEPKGALLAKVIQHHIVIYAAHTNLDKAELGLSDYIAEKIGIDERKPLDPSDAENLYKIVIYVPVDYTDAILEVLGNAGAGFIGRYSHCSFRTVGKGAFKPLEGTNPFIGTTDELTTVEEDRIETIITASIMKNLIRKLKDVHPYEEMAYDVYPLENGNLINQNGLGKIGVLSEPTTPDAFITRLKDILKIDTLRAAGNQPKSIKRVALCTGSGAEFMGLAKVKKADVYITGDLKYHDGQRAKENNLWVIDAGHFGTEKMVTGLLERLLKKAFDGRDLEIMLSEKNEDFIKYY